MGVGTCLLQPDLRTASWAWVRIALRPAHLLRRKQQWDLVAIKDEPAVEIGLLALVKPNNAVQANQKIGESRRSILAGFAHRVTRLTFRGPLFPCW